MADLDNLLKRIDAEFSAVEGRIKHAQQEHAHEYQERQQRLAAFEKLLAELPQIWRPRLEAFVKRFGDRVKVTPKVTATSREATLEFQSDLAHIRLRLSAATDREVRQLVLDYNLEILPILMQFDSHERGEWPLAAVDKQAVTDWIDNRLVSFVKTYLSLHENEYYLKDHMVADPIAGVRFPKHAAAATEEFEGKKHYFISEETRRQFAAKHGAAK